MKIKGDRKQDPRPLAMCVDFTEANGTGVPFVTENLELKKKKI